jgi:uncharacterized membrane protein
LKRLLATAVTALVAGTILSTPALAADPGRFLAADDAVAGSYVVALAGADDLKATTTALPVSTGPR